MLTDGDIESNPGSTFEILKVVQVSFHQGHPKFAHIAGLRNSLYALCWYIVKRVTVCTTWEVDYILENCDGLFKTLNSNHALNVDELPQELNIDGCPLRVTMLKNETGIMIIVDPLHFLKVSHEEKLNTGIGVIFFINGYTFAIIWSKSRYFLCDSHIRNQEGVIRWQWTDTVECKKKVILSWSCFI